jgi:hypothetical protein
MYPATAIRGTEYRIRGFYAEAARERQAIEAERAHDLESGPRRDSFPSLVAAVVAFLAATGSLAGGR